jgi:hypothetical protein
MNRRRLVGLGIVVALISVMASHIVGNVLKADYYARYGRVANDGDVMIWGLLLLSVYMPLVAVGITVMISLVGWLALKKRYNLSPSQALLAITVMVVITTILSFAWSAVIIFT